MIEILCAGHAMHMQRARDAMSSLLLLLLLLLLPHLDVDVVKDFVVRPRFGARYYAFFLPLAKLAQARRWALSSFFALYQLGPRMILLLMILLVALSWYFARRIKVAGSSAIAAASGGRIILYSTPKVDDACPTYWHQRGTSGGGLGLEVIDAKSNEWKVFEGLLEQTRADWLGKGQDQATRGRYNRLEVKRAWRVENPTLWRQYMASAAKVADEVVKCEAVGVAAASPKERTRDVAGGLPGKLDSRTREAYLFHGVSEPENALLNILTNGFKQAYAGNNAGTAFGKGVYFAELAGKSDQYVTIDRGYDASSALHHRLFGSAAAAASTPTTSAVGAASKRPAKSPPKQRPAGASTGGHPGHIFYLILARVARGVHADHFAMHQKVFAPGTDKKELKNVWNNPPVAYHSNFVTSSQLRFNEFVIFHGEYAYPEYIIAFERT
jgi:hypothetical protein